jgi:hypothetical protein
MTSEKLLNLLNIIFSAVVIQAEVTADNTIQNTN